MALASREEYVSGGIRGGRQTLARLWQPVDGHAGPRDPAGARRGQKRHDVADFLGLAEAAERQLAPDELGDFPGLVALTLPPRSAFEEDRPRRDAVDPDVVRAASCCDIAFARLISALP